MWRDGEWRVEKIEKDGIWEEFNDDEESKSERKEKRRRSKEEEENIGGVRGRRGGNVKTQQVGTPYTF
jgi:hypothetical protein